MKELSKKVIYNLTLKKEGAEESNHLYSDFHQKDELTIKRNTQPIGGFIHPRLQTTAKPSGRESTTSSQPKETLGNQLYLN